MGVPQLKQVLEIYSAYREWKKETDGHEYLQKSLYIDFTGIAYGTMCKFVDCEVKREREAALSSGVEWSENEKPDYGNIIEKLCIEEIAKDVLEYKVLQLMPRQDDFDVMKTFRKIFIAHDNKTPLAKVKIQEKRRKNRFVVPKELRDAVADQFYLTLKDHKETRGLRAEIVYDKTLTIGEGEWKCIREIWKDINDGRTESCYVLANDYDIVLGAYCLPSTISRHIDIIWNRQRMENYACYNSKIINWSSNEVVEKLLMVSFLNVYGNDYVPGLITTTGNIQKIKNIITDVKKLLVLRQRREDLYVSLRKIGEFIFGRSDRRPDIDTEEWITTMTFLIFFVYDFLLHAVFRNNNPIDEAIFFEKWENFVQNRNEVREEKNECRRYVVTMFLWYLCYCTNSFNRSETEKEEGRDEHTNANEGNIVLTALPLRKPFLYNDIRTRFDIEVTKKRSLFDHKDESSMKNVYNIIYKIFRNENV